MTSTPLNSTPLFCHPEICIKQLPDARESFVSRESKVRLFLRIRSFYSHALCTILGDFYRIPERHPNRRRTKCTEHMSKKLSGTGDSQRDSRKSIRANHSQLKPLFFIARQADSPESFEFSDSRESPDSHELCESIRANHATKVKRSDTQKD